MSNVPISKLKFILLVRRIIGALMRIGVTLEALKKGNKAVEMSRRIRDHIHSTSSDRLFEDDGYQRNER